MNTTARRGPLRPPNEMSSHDEWLQVHQLDLPGLSLAELLTEEWRAARIAELFPTTIMWREMRPMTVPEWSDERIRICERLRRELLGSEKASPPRKRPKAKPWT